MLGCWQYLSDYRFVTKNVGIVIQIGMKEKEMSINQIKGILSRFKSKTIIWTGGEPTMQLNDEILSHFKEYYNCIETNGTNPVPRDIDYISCSPKVTVEELNINFPNGVNEIRYPVSKETIIPRIEDLPKAKHYFLSPVFWANKMKGLQ